MRVTTLAGTGAQRGLDLGRELRAEITATVTAFKTHLAGLGHPPDPLARRLVSSGLARTAADRSPDLWAEVVSTASGARVPLEDVLLLVFLDEVWALTRPAGCSTVARVLPGEPARPGISDSPPTPAREATTELAQTMDLPVWARDRAQVLRIAAGEAPTALVLTYPGSIGLCGANEAGLAVAVNALPDATSSQQGLGVAFIIRTLLTLTTLADAARYLTSVPHAAGQAYTIAAPDGLACFEADAAGVHRVTTDGVPATAHTNHWLADGAGGRVTTSSRERLDLLVHGLEQHRPFAQILAEDVTVDGERWGDRFWTFAAFRAIGDEPCVRFIDGSSIRSGHREWTKVSFR